jgi:RNA polymerase sigma factor (sigma-70 family)
MRHPTCSPYTAYLPFANFEISGYLSLNRFTNGKEAQCMAQMTDDEIIRDVLEGGPSEERALAWLYEKLLPMVIQHIKSNNGARDDAYDVFQDAILVFTDYVKTDRYRRKSSISTFLMGIVRNTWHNRLRRKGYSEGYVAEMKQILEGAEEPSPDVPDAFWLDQELEKAIVFMLAKLGEKCREILRMRFWDGFKMEKIAVLMQYKTSQIAKNKHFRCIEELRTLLKQDDNLRNYLRGLL